MRQAFVWTCDECGRDNFELAVIAEMSPGDREECYRSFHGMEDYEELPEDWQQFEMVMAPNSVKCPSCGEEFDTTEHDDGETP